MYVLEVYYRKTKNYFPFIIYVDGFDHDGVHCAGKKQKKTLVHLKGVTVKCMTITIQSILIDIRRKMTKYELSFRNSEVEGALSALNEIFKLISIKSNMDNLGQSGMGTDFL